MINPSGDWTNYLPRNVDTQNSDRADSLACGSFSAVHIAESLMMFQYGQPWEFSERALAKLSGTTHQGNYLSNIINAINNYGLMYDSYWPVSKTFTWEEFYERIPNSIVSKCLRFKATLTPLSKNQVKEALKTAPVWTIIPTSGGTNHIVEQINETQYFDSYQILIKNFQANFQPKSYWQLIIKPIIMTNAKLVNNKGEWGFFIPATQESTLIDKALNFGYPLPTKVNGTQVDWENTKADITV